MQHPVGFVIDTDARRAELVDSAPSSPTPRCWSRYSIHALYKKHHWLVRSHTFYSLHLLLDKHAGEQLEIIDSLAERVQTLGGVAVGDPRHVAEITHIPRSPDGVEEVPAMLSGCWKRTKPSSSTHTTPPPASPLRATTARTTCWSPKSSGPASCKPGSSRSTWSTHHWSTPITTPVNVSSRSAFAAEELATYSTTWLAGVKARRAAARRTTSILRRCSRARSASRGRSSSASLG